MSYHETMPDGDDNNGENERESGVTTLAKPSVKEPPLYQVVLINDDYTTMEFVVHVLQKFFQKTPGEANRIMLKVHHEGRGVCGIYPCDIAQTKAVQVNDYARKNETPLKCAVEKI